MAIAAHKTRVEIVLTKDLVERIDAAAKQTKLSRAAFIEAFLDVTLESEKPVIDFAVRLSRIARALWPNGKRKVSVPRGT